MCTKCLEAALGGSSFAHVPLLAVELKDQLEPSFKPQMKTGVCAGTVFFKSHEGLEPRTRPIFIDLLEHSQKTRIFIECVLRHQIGSKVENRNLEIVQIAHQKFKSNESGN